METPRLLRFWSLALGLGLLISHTPGATTFVAPTPPTLDWTTDGVSLPDSSPWSTNTVPQILGVWPFHSPTNLCGARADPPLVASNLFLVPSPWGSALRLAPAAPACLRFGVRQSNTNGDFSVRNGSICLWLRPDWSPGGPTAPTAWVPLVEVGSSSTTRTGWWAWLLSPGGTEVQFLGQARGQQASWLRAPLSLVSNRWTHLALTWTPTNSSLFLNGVRVTDGLGVTHWPESAERNLSGWGIGGDRSGHLRISADWDTVITANYPLSPAAILQLYTTSVASQGSGNSADSIGQSLLPTVEFDLPSRPSTFRSGLWIEPALGALSDRAGGWLHGTTPGMRYEIFAARSPSGPWLLDQVLLGGGGRTWTAFSLQWPPPLPWFAVAAPFADSDQDGLSDEYERRVSRTNTGSKDTDDDGMPDGWEAQYGLDPTKNDGLDDLDDDGLINAMEFFYTRNPSIADPKPRVSVRVTSTPIQEGGTPAKFILKRTGATTQPLEVYVELTGPSVNGYDYTQLPERVTIATGKSELELTVTPLRDGRDERDEAVILTVKRGMLYEPDTVRSAQTVIQDRDLPSVSIRAIDPNAREPELGRTDPGEFELQRSGLTDLPLVVSLRSAAASTAAAGIDTQALPATVTIPAGEIRAKVSVNPINNKKSTGPKLLIAEIVPMPTAYTIESGEGTATVSIADVELPRVSVTADEPMAHEKGLRIGRFKFTRVGDNTRSLTVLYFVGGTAEPSPKDYVLAPADYEILEGSVTIPAGSNDAWVNVTPFADAELETLETVEVTVAGSLDYTIGVNNTATVSIDDSNPAQCKSERLRPTSIAGVDGPEGLIEITRFGTVLTDMNLPFTVSGQRILKPSGQVLSFDDLKLRTMSASYLLTRTVPKAGNFFIPKGDFKLIVGLKATLPSAEVKGATLILSPGTPKQETHPIHFLDRWHLVSFQPTADNIVEGGQMTLKVSAAAADPTSISGTSVRFLMLGTADPERDIVITGASGTGIDESGKRYVEVSIPAAPPSAAIARSATLTIRAVADGRTESKPNLLVLQYSPKQAGSALSAAQQARPYSPLQMRDSTAIRLPALDCDQDGFPDTYEVNHDMDPLTPSISVQDKDRDGLLDLEELTKDTRYDVIDTDGDGVNDFIEGVLGFNPLVADVNLAAQVQDRVPIILRTTGMLRGSIGDCYECHGPGMAFDTIQMMQESPRPSLVRTRHLLLAPGATHSVSLTAPKSYVPNVKHYMTYSAEVLAPFANQPTGFIIEETDPKQPLLGRVLPILPETFTSRRATLRVLRRPLIGVDANRDGSIRLDASDATSLERPYRFWVNNDNDVSSSNLNPEKLDSPVQDHSDATIRNTRDLEDFARLWIDLQGIQSVARLPDTELAFEWRNVTEGAPAIQIYNSVETDGGLRYLSEIATASQQSLPDANLPGFAYAISPSNSSIRRIDPGTRFVFRPGFWSGTPNRQYLLFEAAARGKGQLVLMLLQKGRIVVESDPIHFELLDIKEMYSRVQATPSEGFPKPYEFPETPPPPIQPDIAPLLLEHEFRPDPSAQATTLTFVHGWNTRLNESLNFSETMYKRLWHAGYRGTLSSFRWPTDVLMTPEVLDSELFDSYNFSEHRALIYGPSLKKHIESISSRQRTPVICHSMGSMVVASALHQGMAVPTVLFFQAATPASFFDADPRLNEDSLVAAEASALTGLRTPDTFQNDRGYRGYLAQEPGSFKNYYNTDDFALQTGSYALKLIEANWISNQIQSKPHLPGRSAVRGYVWLSRTENGGENSSSYMAVRALRYRLLRPVVEDEENLAFVARSRTRALGAEPRTRGLLNSSNLRDLSTMNLQRTRADHSGQFNRGIQETQQIYKTTLADLQ